MKNILNVLKNVLKGIAFFIIMIAVFCLILTFSYALPNTNIRQHLADSVETIKSEGGFYYRPFFGTQNVFAEAHTLDDYTDSLILCAALDKGEDQGKNVFDRAMENYRYEDKEKGPVESFADAIDENNEANSNYTRYWFGIEAFLRPLLLLFNFQTIRYINMIFIFILLVSSTVLISKKLGLKYAIAFDTAIFFMGITIIPVSLQYIPVMAITLIASIVILCVENSKKFDKLLPYFFIAIGGCTAFMDLLTYPLVTLGIPMVLVILLKLKHGSNFKDLMITIIKLSIIWGISYGATYFVKWVITSIVMGQNVITEAINQFLYRIDADGSTQISKFEVISRNFKVYFNAFVLGLLVIYLIFWAIGLKKYRKENINVKNIIPLIIFALIPYAWYIVLSNHSGIHYWMTYRIQAITLLSLISASLYVIDDEKIKKIGKEKE